VFTNRQADSKKLTQLSRENRFVRQEIARIEKNLAEINDLIDSLKMYDEKLRSYAVLNPIDEELRAMGIGGTGPEINAEIPEDISDNIAELSQLLDQLLARSRFQKVSFQQLTSKIDEQKYLRSHTPSIVPVQGWFMSGFGFRIDPFTSEVRMHEGIDIAAPSGTPIIATADGIVCFAGENGGFGLALEIDHGYGIKTRYCHCQRLAFEVDQPVRRGDTIAYVGNTGKSTGPHLHYEVRVVNQAVNPINYIIPSSVIID
jgi:murein DD-endopeptidase MepM/ murein hydrolase activator NlpD